MRAVAGLPWIARIVGSFGVLLIGVAALYWTPLTANHALILDYLRVAASWPIIVFVLGCIVLVKFQIPLTELIGRVAVIRVPGGELRVRQSGPPDALIPTPAAGPSAAPNQDAAKLWEFLFLNYFLVPTTQWILEMLCKSPSGLTHQDFTSALLPDVPPNSVEPNAIYNALLRHNLIEGSENGNIKATAKGMEYRTFRGTFETVSQFWWAARMPPPPINPSAPTLGRG